MSPEVAGVSEDFPVTFEDPADAQLTWERDDMHMPFALPPLAGDYVATIIGESFNEHWRMFGAPQRMRGAVWNGWTYYAYMANVPDEDKTAAGERWVAVLRSRIAVTHTWWSSEALPELAGIYAHLAGIPVDELPPAALADAWVDAWAIILRAWEIHFIAIMGPYQVLEDLSDAYSGAVGPGRDAEALALIRGAHHELEEVEAGSERLAALAASHPELAHRLASNEMAPTREEMALIPGGSAFLVALDDFLEQHGHLGQAHDDLSFASWAEDPAVFLGKIAKRLTHPPASSSEREARLAREADEIAERARAALAGKPEDLAAFETTLQHARETGYLTEGHNYWIDRMAQARLRQFVRRVGARLAREGRLDTADDVFFLHRGEVDATVRDGLDRRALVVERRATHERNTKLTPPQYVGVTPATPSTGDRFDGERFTSTDPNVLQGTGASAGVVRGPARVALSQEDFGRILPGDIIVCPSSNPSWVPVFTIAGGLVTNTGGVLSHAAVVAREFGLPAVVGTGDATTRIQDGQQVEIDGTAGTVRLL
jgi:phosphohistidine swiveling domain-containing protein